MAGESGWKCLQGNLAGVPEAHPHAVAVVEEVTAMNVAGQGNSAFISLMKWNSSNVERKMWDILLSIIAEFVSALISRLK